MTTKTELNATRAVLAVLVFAVLSLTVCLQAERSALKQAVRQIEGKGTR
jgi:hypothetical protein